MRSYIFVGPKSCVSFGRVASFAPARRDQMRKVAVGFFPWITMRGRTTDTILKYPRRHLEDLGFGGRRTGTASLLVKAERRQIKCHEPASSALSTESIRVFAIRGVVRVDLFHRSESRIAIAMNNRARAFSQSESAFNYSFICFPRPACVPRWLGRFSHERKFTACATRAHSQNTIVRTRIKA